LEEYAYNENRYRTLKTTNPEVAAALMKQAEADVKRRWKYFKAQGFVVSPKSRGSAHQYFLCR